MRPHPKSLPSESPTCNTVQWPITLMGTGPGGAVVVDSPLVELVVGAADEEEIRVVVVVVVVSEEEAVAKPHPRAGSLSVRGLIMGDCDDRGGAGSVVEVATVVELEFSLVDVLVDEEVVVVVEDSVAALFFEPFRTAPVTINASSNVERSTRKGQ